MKHAAFHDRSVVDKVAADGPSIKRRAMDIHRIGGVPLGFDGKCNSTGHVYDRTRK